MKALGQACARDYWARALLNHMLPERIVLGKHGERGTVRAGREGEGMGALPEDNRVFGIAGNWNTAALDPGTWSDIVCERGRGLMTMHA